MQLFIEDHQKPRINAPLFLSASEAVDLASDLLRLAREEREIRQLCQRHRWLVISLDPDETREPEGRDPIDADDI